MLVSETGLRLTIHPNISFFHFGLLDPEVLKSFVLQSMSAQDSEEKLFNQCVVNMVTT